MKPVNFPSPELLRELLRYDPATGKLYWLERTPNMFKQSGYGGSNGCCRRWNARHAESEAFTACDGQGYLQGSVLGKNLRAHRVVWAFSTLRWPINQIDHLNGNRSDNRIENLREATPSENQRNKRLNANNTSGHNGVTWNKRAKKWIAQMKLNGVYTYLGLFDQKQDAIDARKNASNMHNFSERHGKS